MNAPELEKLRAQLAASSRKMEIIQKVLFELNKLVSLPEKLTTILRILDEQFGVTHSMILIPDSTHKTLTVYASHGYAGGNVGTQVSYGQGPAGIAASRKKHINLTGIKRKQHYLAVVSGGQQVSSGNFIGLGNVESQVAIPLISQDELVAVLMAESHDLCVFNESDENFLLTLAQPLAVSIQSSMLYDGLELKIQDRTAELQRLNQTKDKLFSIISHDLRGPVTSFQGLTQLLNHYNRTGQADKIEHLCAKVDQSVSHLNLLLENLLDWSLTQTQGIQCSFERIPLCDFLQDIVEIYRHQIASKEIQLHTEIAPVEIHGDPPTLATVFRNVISNAIKFTPRGGEISLAATTVENAVVVTLSDTGVGIADDQLKSLFQLPTRRVSYGTEKERGTGLGLILVKEFLDMNGGKMAIASSPQGTRVSLTLQVPVKS